LHQEEELRDRTGPNLTVPDLIEYAARCSGIAPERVYQRSKDPRVSDVRGLVCFLATKILEARSSEVGSVLGLGQSGVSRNVARGRTVWNANREVRDGLRSFGFDPSSKIP
jgi:hypothetical protein